MKKFLALALAIIMVLALGVPALADTTGTTVTGNSFTYVDADKTADGQIKMTNATKDVTYTLYKIFDANYSGENVAYTVKAGALKDALVADGYFTVGETADANGNFSVVRKTEKTDAQIIEYITKLVADHPDYVTKIGAIKSTANGTITFDKIPYGYYLIQPDTPADPKAAVTIDSNVPTATVIDKNQVTSFDKNIVDGEDLVKVNQAGLNIDVPFDITVNAKNYDKEYLVYEYTIKDTIDPGFTFKNDLTVKIAPDGTTDWSGVAAKTAPTDYTITYYTDAAKTTKIEDPSDATAMATAQYFEIVIKWTDTGTYQGTHLYDANSIIKVNYTAFLDPDKADQVSVGATPNKNKAEVTFKEDKGEDHEEVNGELPASETETYETQVTIQKTDNDNKSLTGAEFELTTEDGTKVSYVKKETFVADAEGTYYKLKDGTYTETAPTEGTQDQYEDTTTKYKKVSVYEAEGQGQTPSTMKAFVGDDGRLTFSGLGIGTYTLKETTVPNGYNRAADITFKITFDPETKKFASSNASVTLDGTNNVFNTNVVNNKGTELPSTGGIGTTIFYVLGGLLVAFAVVFLITKTRMSKEQ